MAMGNVTLTGDWPRFRFIINNFTPKLRIAIRAAARKNAIMVLREIRKGIREQAPGGKVFTPLHELTVREKASFKGIGGVKSNQALIRHGDLIRLLTFEVDPNGSFSVGYPAGVKNSAGVDMNMIAGLMEKGFTIRVTDRLRKYFAAKGTPLKKSTTHLDVPARPFLQPVFDSLKDEILMNYAIAIDMVLRGNPSIGFAADTGGEDI
jgi:hypothetical protein